MADYPPHQDQMAGLLMERLDVLGMTQAELGRRVGMTQKHISLVLNGHKTAAPGTLDYWAFVLGCEWHVELRPVPAESAPQAGEGTDRV